MAEAIRTVTPVVQGIRDVSGLLSPDLIRPRTFSEQATDYVGAVDELARLHDEDQKSYAGRLVANTIHGALLGGGAGLLKGTLWNRSATTPGTAAMALGLAALGGGSAAGFTSARHLLRNRLKSRALTTIEKTPEPVRHLLQTPSLQHDIRGYERAAWYPWYGLEAGALAGGLGALGVGWAAGKDPKANPGLTALGGLGGAAAGGVLGYVLKERQRRKLLEKAEEALRQQNTVKTASRLDRLAARRGMTRAEVDAWTTGLVQDQIAQAKTAVIRGGETTKHIKTIPPGPRWENWSGTGEHDLVTIRDPADFAKRERAMVDEFLAKTAAEKRDVTLTYNAKQIPPAPGWPALPSNAWKMRGTPAIEYYSGGQNQYGQPYIDTHVTRASGGAPVVQGEVKAAMETIGLEATCQDVMARALCAVFAKVASPEPSVPEQHPSAPKQVLRPRSEVICTSEKGVLCLDKGDYILFPGGGIADGEEADHAVIREGMEEAGRNFIRLRPLGVVESVWPPEGKMRAEGFDGERTHFFAARDGGDSLTTHPDREGFDWQAPAKIAERIRDLIRSEKDTWAVANNQARLDALLGHESLQAKLAAALPAPGPVQTPGIQPTPAQQFTNQKLTSAAPAASPAPQLPSASAPQGTPPGAPMAAPAAPVPDPVAGGPNGIQNGVPDAPGAKELGLGKQADAVSLLPRSEYVSFDPSGKLIVRRRENRRFDFPSEGTGKRVPYEQDISFVPGSGVPEPGVQGYRVGLHLGDPVAQVPEGFEAVDPDQALKDLYASMGLSANRDYQNWDRARARAILRVLKSRKPVPAPVQAAPGAGDDSIIH